MKPFRPQNPACQVCGKTRTKTRLIPGDLVSAPVAEEIRKQFPEWSADGFICQADLNRFRIQYIQSLLVAEKGELTSLEQEVVESLARQETLSSNIDVQFERELTFGERLADRIADIGGSWTFILSFGGFLLLWVLLNSYFLLAKPFDPYPYILLNLVLSCLAALQAPIIMMSQNRQEAKDRLRSENDYRVNLKAELEIRHLHEKIDHLLSRQWERLVEIQQIQLELMSELTRKR
ncbi:MAG: DUF1003 domain-containing protein [Desulfuromonadales bacterium]|jgi:uncharacterized membrane protein